MKKNKPKILALIPARAGSKRVKNKNIRLLGDKPLIAYTIIAAKKSKYIEKIIVSTDSAKIAKIAKTYGAEVPFLRPKEISNENSTEYEFHYHALQWLKVNEQYEPDIIVNLYPTTPFRKTLTIDKAIEKLISNPQADSLRSLKKCSEHPYKMWISNEDIIRPFVNTKNPSDHTAAYHLLPQVFIQNASIYIVRKNVITKFKNTIGKIVVGYEMNEVESLDINIPLDFYKAEQLLKCIKV